MSLEPFIIVGIIAFPTFFILNWLLKRLIKDNSTRILVTSFGTLIISPAIYLGVLYIYLNLLFAQPQYDFNQEKWFSSKESRFEMKEDIVKSKILIEKTKTDVIALLGKTKADFSANTWTYDLGSSNLGLGFEIDFLQISFKNNKVDTVQIIELID